MILNEKTSFYKVCFDSMQVGIIVFNKDKNIVLANIPSSQLFGYEQKEILNQKINNLLQDSTILDRYINNPQSKIYKSTVELIGLKKNGKEIFIELSFGKIEYEGAYYYKALISDISKRKKKEKKINHLNIQLEEEVKLRNSELEKLIEQLKISLSKEKELNNLKTKFITLASHEFKTPLSAILSSTELMVKYADLHNIEKRQEHLEKVKIMIYRLNGMIDDILSLEDPNFKALVETRILLELKSAGLAASRRSKDDLIKIETALNAYEDKVNLGEDAVQEDLLFHLSIAKASGNSTLNKLMLIITPGIITNFEKYHVCDKDKAILGIQEHRAIFNAIKDQKPDLAKEKIKIHFSELYQYCYSVE